MIDYLIPDPTKKIGFILSCILKFMNLLIFRVFQEFFLIFLNFYGFIFIEKYKKISF